jgi:glycoside/pentoside/hexuronide:cation symporter, GPH family
MPTTSQETVQNMSQKVPFREKLAFGCGDLASVLYWQTFMLYFTFFYTDVFLIPAGAAAAMFLVSRLWDGVNDPLMGMIADRTQTRWGKFRPYLLWLCVPFAIAGVLTFTVPDLGAVGKLIWAYATFILIMMLYTAINIPYTALFGVVSADSKERTTVSSVKFFFAFTAGIIVSATLLPMVRSIGKGDMSIISARIDQQTIQIQEVGKGVARILLYAEDPKGLVATTDFAVRIIPTDNNLPTVVNPVSDIQLESGFQTHAVNLSDIFSDGGEKSFKYSIENTNPDVIDAAIEDDTVVLSEKQTGNAKLVLTASDPYWGSSTYNLFVDVIAKGNKVPVAALSFLGHH